MRRIHVLLALIALAGCSRHDRPDVHRTSLPGLALAKGDPNAKVARNITVTGRWESRPDARGRRIVLEIAGNQEYTIDLEGQEHGAASVYATGRGRSVWSSSDTLKGSGTATGDLGRFRTWEAGFPAKDRMTLQSDAGTMEFTHHGL